MTAEKTTPPSQGTVELFDNGKLVGYPAMTSDDEWEFVLKNLSEGLHVLTAKSGDTLSEAHNIQVASSSGSENWKGFVSGQRLTSERFYFAQSGLAFCIKIIENDIAQFWSGDDKKMILSVDGIHEAVLAVIFPVAATHITLSIAHGMYNGNREERVIFITPDNDSIERKMATTVGDQTFEFGFPVKSFVFYPKGSLQFSSPTVSVSKISWDSPHNS